MVAMQFVMTGVSAMISNKYDPFSDFTSLLVIAMWLVLIHWTKKLVVFVATRVFNVWDYKKFHSAKVGVGKGEEKEKEGDKLEISEYSLIDMKEANEGNGSAL